MSEETELKTALVVCDIVSLSRYGKKFDGDTKKGTIKHEGTLISRAYAEEMNEHWKSRGVKCVIDEQASVDAQEERESQAAKRLERDKARDTAGKAVAAMALGINSKDDEDKPVGSMAHSVKELKEMESLKSMSDEELDEFFKTEERTSGKNYLGELITANNN